MDAPSTIEFQILDSLTEKDKGQICYNLRIISACPLTPAMPPHVTFQLHGVGLNPLDYADRTATFMTENQRPTRSPQSETQTELRSQRNDPRRYRPKALSMMR
jgi:hypothetical protein